MKLREREKGEKDRQNGDNRQNEEFGHLHLAVFDI
jgi:hypothetical protein